MLERDLTVDIGKVQSSHYDVERSSWADGSVDFKKVYNH